MVLGITQDTGYPQINCSKNCCSEAWKKPKLRKMTSSLAIVDPTSNQQWILDATPNITEQLQLLNKNSGIRNIEGIFISQDFMRMYNYGNTFSHLLGYTNKPNQDEISSFLNKSKVFLFTSRKEGVAKVTAEAALCNLPVVMYKNFFGSANRGINKKYLYYYDSIESAYDIISNILAEYNIEENVFTNDH